MENIRDDERNKSLFVIKNIILKEEFWNFIVEGK